MIRTALKETDLYDGNVHHRSSVAARVGDPCALAFAWVCDLRTRTDSRTAPFPYGAESRLRHALTTAQADSRKPKPAIQTGLRFFQNVPSYSPYGIRTRAAAVRGRCPRPLDEWAVRQGSVPNPTASALATRAGRLLRRRDRVSVAIASVDPGLEASSDLFTRHEQRVVACATRGEFDDPYCLVAIAMTARVRGRLIERSQALTIASKPCHHQTPSTFRPAWEPGREDGYRTLHRKPSAPLRPGLAGPRTPIPARRDEVPVRGLGLFDRRRAMTEDPTLVRAHLEESQVLSVLGIRPVTRLTA